MLAAGDTIGLADLDRRPIRFKPAGSAVTPAGFGFSAVGADAILGESEVKTADDRDVLLVVSVTLNGPVDAVVATDGVAEETLRKCAVVTCGYMPPEPA